jgi:hypothetical protein
MSGVKVNNGIINYGGMPSGGGGLLAARPAAGVVGRIYISSDTLQLFRDTGSGWATIGGGGITGAGAAGQAAFWTGASAISGDNAFFWDNTNKRLGINTATPGVRLDIHGTGVIAQFNGTTTNSAFLNFQNAGTSRFSIGNDYNGSVQMFAILNNVTSTYFIAGTQSNNRMMFNSPNLTPIGAAQFEFYNFTGLTAIANFQFTNDNTAAFYNTYKTRSTTKGSYVSTLNNDNLGSFAVAGSDTTMYLGSSQINFVQSGSVTPGVSAPSNIFFNQYTSAGSLLSRLILYKSGYSTFLDRVNVNNATDNALFELNNNGNFYTGGLSPTILTVAVNTTMARTATGYYCTASLTLTLPSAASLNNIYWIIAASGVTVTVNRAGTDDILNLAGASVTTISITSNQRAMFYVGGGTRTFLISQA